MTLRDRREQLKGAFRASLSPPAWKDQLKQRCMQRLRADRHLLLAKLRSPDGGGGGARSVADEVKRLVRSEQQKRHPVFDLQRESGSDNEDMRTAAYLGDDDDDAEDTDDVFLEELVAAGKLSEDDYLDIVHALEDELLEETAGGVAGGEREEQLAEHMVEFEEASLEAMLAGLDLGVPDDFFDDEFDCDDDSACGNGVFVLCPICKVGSVKETPTAGRFPALACACGFSLQTAQEPLHGALEDFQERVATAFMAHRERCSADPSFEKAVAFGPAGPCDALRLECRECRASHQLL